MIRNTLYTLRTSIRHAHIGHDSHIRAVQLYYKVTTNERVSKVLRETANVLILKGFTKPVLSPQDQLKLFTDKDIVRSMDNFKRILDQEKIQLDIADINDFLRFFTSDKYIIEH